MKRRIQVSFDHVMQGVIRLCMLTGVTFLVTACYGVQPEHSPEQEAEVEQIEQALNTIENA